MPLLLCGAFIDCCEPAAPSLSFGMSSGTVSGLIHFIGRRHLFSGHRTSPSGGGTTKTPYGLDVGARLGELAEAGFTADEPELIDWTLTLDPPAVRRLYATYSNVTALPADERERLLSGLEKVAETEFAGVVTRNMTTSVYTGRRE